MTRRAFFATVIGVTVTPSAVMARTGFHVTGRLTATDQEAQEGYFAVGKDLQFVARQSSPVYDDLRAMVDKTVQCSVVVP